MKEKKITANLTNRHKRKAVNAYGEKPLLCILVLFLGLFPPALWGQSADNQAGGASAAPVQPAAELPQNGEAPEDGVEAESFLPMQVLATTSPANPVVRGNLALTVLVDHFPTSEVTVKPPAFPSAVILERVRTESRYITQPGNLDESGPASEPRRWTAV